MRRKNSSISLAAFIDACRRRLNAPAAGLFLLLISFLVGLTKVYYGRFVDEADTLTTGWLISEGYALYRDAFSHHFPFSYYWAAGVVSLFGNSFSAARISLLVLQIALFALTMGITRFYLAIGLTSLIWNLINQFLRGQQLIYPNFDALLMLSVFILVFWLLIKKSPAHKLVLAVIGVLSALALLNDPLMIYPVGVAFAGLFFSGVLSNNPSQRYEGLKRVIFAGAAAALVVAIFAAGLLATGTLQDFFRDAIVFNAEIYPKYVDAQPFPVWNILKNVATGLTIWDPRWVQVISPFMPLETYRSVGLADEALHAAWIFSNFLFRLSILVCTVGLILNRRAAAGLFLYVFSASLLIRADAGYYVNNFALTAIFAAFYAFIELPQLAVIEEKISTTATSRSILWKGAKAAWTSAGLLLIAMLGWSAWRGASFLRENQRAVMSDRHVDMYYGFGDQIRAMSCNSSDIELSVFPINPIVNFVTGIPPASRYTFMYPWVAEVGQQELIANLKENPSAVVWINLERKADSPDGVATYMAPTIDFLNREYISLQGGLWMSPELYERCGANTGELPVD